MKELTVAIQDEYEGKVVYRTKIYTEEEYKKLEQENKKLKGLLKEHVTSYDVHFDKLIEENKKLKEELGIWKLTAKDYARQCGIELNDDLNI